MPKQENYIIINLIKKKILIDPLLLVVKVLVNRHPELVQMILEEKVKKVLAQH